MLNSFISVLSQRSAVRHKKQLVRLENILVWPKIPVLVHKNTLRRSDSREKQLVCSLITRLKMVRNDLTDCGCLFAALLVCDNTFLLPPPDGKFS